jgi:tartrate dehydrogenase/decarboxylase/D-malate dehydrogenase
VSLWGLLIPIRQGFDQYINLRPVKLLPGVPGPLRLRQGQIIDMLFVRENSEGEYSGMGGRFHRGRPDEMALQTGVFTRKGIERVVRYAFDLASRRPRRRLCSATKSNALQFSMVLWDEIVADVAAQFPDVTVDKQHVDALAARMLTAPQTLDVVVGSNLFGDILTDIGGALQGSLGIPAGANLNPERSYPSLFEPVHGSAPDIAGKGIANPIAAVWAAAMMLGHLGLPESEALVMRSIDALCTEGAVLTPDLGGTAHTIAVTERLSALAREIAGR